MKTSPTTYDEYLATYYGTLPPMTRERWTKVRSILQPKEPLTFRQLIEVSCARSDRWHQKQEPWTPTDWAVAMEGEAGELTDAVLDLCLLVLTIKGHSGQMLNALKKLRRVETGAPNINEKERLLSTVAAAKDKIGRELADVIIYMPSLARALGLDMEQYIREVFNQKSVEYGFPERL